MTADRRAEPDSSGAGGTHRLPAAQASDDRDRRADQARIGEYELIRKIGEGGMGVVYKALDDDGRAVAVKVLRAHIAHDASARERLRREVSTLVRVESPHVASFLDADVDGESPYLVTSFVPGAALDEVVEDDGPFGAARLARLGRGLAEALGAIHAAGIVHRDLKPGNVLMVGDDPVLIDFGIAHVADDSRLTSTGLVMGTPGYLSPEIVEGESVTQATDWWGWAATLAYAASGHAPFGRGPMPVVLDRVCRGEYDLSGVDARIRPLLEAALDPDPQRRPDAAEVLSALDVFAHGGHTGQIPVIAQRRPAPQPRDARKPSTERFAAPKPATERLAAPKPGTERIVRPARQPDPTENLGAPPQRVAPARYDIQRPVNRAGDPDRPVPSVAPGRFVPPPDPRIGQAARTGTLAALLAALTGIAAVLPSVALVLLVLWALAARWCDKAITSRVLRRYTAGPRRSDNLVAAVSSPWHGVVAALATLLTVLIPGFVGACTAIAVALARSMIKGGPVYIGRPLPMALGVLVGAVVMWWGPGGISLRRGARSIVRGAVRGQPMTQIIIGVCALVAVIGVVFAVTHLGTAASWWPVPGDSSLRLQLGAMNPAGSMPDSPAIS
ncbi:serine/threonine-protein kinase [Flexivirga caeni]|uniref:Serine/threonine protein kinase n=1 Tax=Flexivirga caeni TaxID=2294115 RepID=A0A3M9MF96_9MICO|nr:serine/threonine-protein kinase [Flexivirga caeni]RNI23817.1 serine/threonine protein kinase [Flexivirga caeni]